MPPEFDASKVDWNNPGVIYLFRYFSARFEEKEREDRQRKEESIQLKEENKQLKERIKQLEETNLPRQQSGSSQTDKRSYNVRKYKDYPRTDSGKRAKGGFAYSTKFEVTHRMPADIQHCPACGDKLSASAVSTTKNVIGMVDGQVRCTQWIVKRRYCKKCKQQYSAPIPGVLKNQKYDNDIFAKITAMRYIGITFGDMAKIFGMMYNLSIDISTLEHGCYVSARHMLPLYEKTIKRINKAKAVYGDETGWFLNGLRYWVWVVASEDSVAYHISPTRSKLVATALLVDFVGTLVSDSYAGWNGIGTRQQKCLLHYFRDMYRTLEGNPSEDFELFFTELHLILKDIIAAWESRRTSCRNVPVETIQGLRDKIKTLAQKTYEDPDCDRYAKRLKKEGDSLLVCLEEYVEYHNNTSERLLRMFALMRKVSYGSRSEKGMQTTEIIATVCATCELRGINPHEFIRDYLDGKVDDIPMPKAPVAVCA